MAFTVSPSVIIREVDASATVPAIATPPGAIAGVFGWGPVNEPILVTSEDNLVNRFGKPTGDNFETFFTAADFLAYGSPLFVTRADNEAIAATATASEDILDANGDVVGTTTFTAGFQAKYKGSIGNSIDVAYCRGDDFESTVILEGDIPTNTIGQIGSPTPQEIQFNSTSFTFQMAKVDKLTNGEDSFNPQDIVIIGNDTFGYQELEVVSFVETGVDANGAPEANTDIIAAYEYTLSFASRYTLAITDADEIALTRKWKHASLFGKPASDNNHYHIVVLDNDGTISGTAGAVLETYNDVSKVAGAQLNDGTDNYYVSVIENKSSWVKTANTTYFAAATTAYETLTGGTNGLSETNVTLASLGPAYDTFKNANEIDISFVLTGKSDALATIPNYIVSNIVDYRKDCVAYISPSRGVAVDEATSNGKLTKIINWRNQLQNSSYWFMDSGYKYRYDKYNDVYRWVPLNGDMAGLGARVESWESPAGFRKGVVKNVVKLSFNPDKSQRDQLYAKDINPVMSQVGQGVVLFGDKTGLGTTSAFDRINVRRLFIAVEKAIATAAQSFLFELNDEFTQTQFKNAVEPFLRDIQGRRGIIDFRIVSDTSLNTPTVIDQNRFRANIFIKPARSINVIELTFVATRSGVEFDEIVGQLT